MPQIWMTYDEMAAMLDCSAMEARDRVHLERLDRKISRDGKTRIKLSISMIGIFIERLKNIDCISDSAVEDLRARQWSQDGQPRIRGSEPSHGKLGTWDDVCR